MQAYIMCEADEETNQTYIIKEEYLWQCRSMETMIIPELTTRRE